MNEQNKLDEKLDVDFIKLMNEIFKSKIKKNITYSEKEVKKLCFEAAIINFDKNNMLQEFENWFNINKKKY